jgi:hypothetical protein
MTSVPGQTQGKDVSQVKVLAAALNVEPFKTKLIDVVGERQRLTKKTTVRNFIKVAD